SRMENGAAQAEAAPRGKFRGNLSLGPGKANSGKLRTEARVELDAQRMQRAPRVGHQPLAACLVNRRTQRVGDQHIGTALPQCNGGRKSRRTTADHQYIAAAIS